MSGALPIVLAAGGTGGHVFPAQALAEELLERGRDLALVTDRRGHHYRGALGRIVTHEVRAGTVSGRSLGGKVVGLMDAAFGLLQARRLLAKLRPGVVVGFGGYPSLPTVLAATGAGISTLIHEQNAVLGRVNRLLAPRVTRVATSFVDTRGIDAQAGPSVDVTGNPVRGEIGALRDRYYEAPGREGPLHLFVIGGSQGAAVLSHVVPAALARLPEGLRRRLRVSQQCRPEDIELVRTLYGAAAIEAELNTFFTDVPRRLGRAHLVIARAGASTVSELMISGRPAILVPYRYAADGHQSLNARAMSEVGAAWTIEENVLDAEGLALYVRPLLEEPTRLSQAAAQAHDLGRPDAARALADLTEALAPANGNGAEREAAA
jgi:UDP-N-acetylglucosamine--N-acetylmuramyl-(pentapeptide) pyrophosphoryl-undecaprenol N-acetylglucosamine transferase